MYREHTVALCGCDSRYEGVPAAREQCGYTVNIQLTETLTEARDRCLCFPPTTSLPPFALSTALLTFPPSCLQSNAATRSSRVRNPLQSSFRLVRISRYCFAVKADQTGRVDFNFRFLLHLRVVLRVATKHLVQYMLSISLIYRRRSFRSLELWRECSGIDSLTNRIVENGKYFHCSENSFGQ